MNNELKAFAYLLIYPDRVLIDALEKIEFVFFHSKLLDESNKESLKELIHWLASSPLTETQDLYVSTFDNNRSRSLNLFEHLQGDSRERGASMVHLMQLYSDYDLELSSDELPDFLPIILEFLSGLNITDAEIWLKSIAPLIASLDSELVMIKSPWSVITGTLLTLAKHERILKKKAIEPEKKEDESPIRFIASKSLGFNR